MSLNRASILGLGVCLYFGKRISKNMQDLEKNTQEKKLFDPLKAKAQVQVYKQIYNIDDEGKNEAELKILQSASSKDKQDIAKYFKKADGGDKSKAE